MNDIYKPAGSVDKADPSEEQDGKPTVLPENKELAEEVAIETEKLELEKKKREVVDQRAAFNRGMTLEEAEAFKRQTLAEMEQTAAEKQEFANQKEARIVKF